jgi:4-hydroxybenzoate polyprenyltransferase
MALLVYSPVARIFPLIKDAYTAVLCSFPLFYAAALTHKHVPSVVYILLLLFVFGRELLMDAEEREGDESAGILTIASRLGEVTTRIIAWLAMFVAAVISLAWPAQGWHFALGVIALMLLLITYSAERQRQVSMSRLPMLLLGVAVVLSL